MRDLMYILAFVFLIWVWRNPEEAHQEWQALTGTPPCPGKVSPSASTGASGTNTLGRS